MITIDTKECDLIISNLALQWAHNLWEVLRHFSANAELFAFSTLLRGTFREWHDVVSRYGGIIYHQDPTEKELIRSCNKMKNGSEFYHWTTDIPLTFDSARSFVRYLKDLGATASSNRIAAGNLKVLLEKHNKPLTVSYKVFFGIFKRVE